MIADYIGMGARRAVDQLKAFTSLRVDTFEGVVGSDVEAWFRQLDIAFRQLRTPLEDRVGLAKTCLKGDAFDEWHSQRSERPTWTFEEFHNLMIREYLSLGIQISRDTAFYTTGYDSTLPVAAVIA